MIALPSSPACERNRQPIGDALADRLATPQRVFEIGSGTGQHAEYLGERFPLVRWQPSDVNPSTSGLADRIAAAGLANVAPPIAFALGGSPPSARGPYDGVFAANVLHIVSGALVERFFPTARALLRSGGWLAVYGPFRVAGEFTSEGDRRLDQWARASFDDAGIRNLEQILEQAGRNGLDLEANQLLPANNRLLTFVAT